MFSLVITVIAIALVAALALSTLYYGGGSFNKGDTAARAAQILTQGQQVIAAADLFKADKGRWPDSVNEMVSTNYLKQTPGVSSPTGNGSLVLWSMPTVAKPTFILESAVSTEVCQLVNLKSRGDDGILKTARTSLYSQCFGESQSVLNVVVSKAPTDLPQDLPAGMASSSAIPSDVNSSDWLIAPGMGALEQAPAPTVSPFVATRVVPSPLGGGERNNDLVQRLNMVTIWSLDLEGMWWTESNDFIRITNGGETDAVFNFTPGPNMRGLETIAANLGWDMDTARQQMLWSGQVYCEPNLVLAAGGYCDIEIDVPRNCDFAYTAMQGPLEFKVGPEQCFKPGLTLDYVYIYGTDGDYSEHQQVSYSLNTNGYLTAYGMPDFNPAEGQWTLIGGALPEGIVLNSDGTLTGVSTTPGDYDFQVAYQYKDFYLTAEGYMGISPLTISSFFQWRNPGPAYEGEPYALDLYPYTSASHDPDLPREKLTYTAITPMPEGLTLSSDGRVSGVAQSDGSGQMRVVTVTIRHAFEDHFTDIPINFTIYPVDFWTYFRDTYFVYQGVAHEYIWTNLVQANSDTAYSPGNYTWELESGSLPAGMTLSSNGILQGTPSQQETVTARIKVIYKGASESNDVTFISGPDVVGNKAVQISGTEAFVCALLENRTVKCWGSYYLSTAFNYQGPSVPALPVPGITDAVKLDAGGYGGCVVTSAGAAQCWGSIVGDSRSPAQTPQGLESGVVDVAVGQDAACAVMVTGQVKCWGYNKKGILGVSLGTVYSATPLLIPSLTDAVDVDVENGRACVVTSSGAAKCWGNNEFGMLGDNRESGDYSLTPRPVFGLSAGVTSVSLAMSTSCAVVNSGAKCWGAPLNGGSLTPGYLGNGTMNTSPIPVDVSGLTSGVAKLSSLSNVCALTTAGRPYCWGPYYGVGTKDSFRSTTTPAPLGDVGIAVQDIALSSQFKCALRTSGGVSCWGVYYLFNWGSKDSTPEDVPL